MEESKNELDELEKNETEEHEYTTTYKLNSYGIDFDVNGLVRRQNSHSIYLPDFQRNYVWSKKKASKFIESLLLGLPIPSVCLYKEEDNKQIIIDGFQRLESIRLFYSKKFSDGSKFALVSVNSSFEGKTIEDLDEELRLKLDDTLIHATVVKADDPQEQNYNAVYLIFERLNTGGVNLTPQEIRSCVYHGSFQKIIQNLVKDENFKKVLIVSSKRKKDQEIVIRLLSLADSYEEYTGNMKEFLNQYCDINKNKSEADCSVQVNLFNQTFSFLSQLDSNIFRPSKVLNLAILDAVFVGTYKYLQTGKKLDLKKYSSAIRAMVNSADFQKNIETGKTHHSVPLKERIEIAIKKIQECNE